MMTKHSPLLPSLLAALVAIVAVPDRANAQAPSTRFDVKGLGLGITKSDLQSGWDGLWKCVVMSDFPEIERCRMYRPTIFCNGKLTHLAALCTGSRAKLDDRTLQVRTRGLLTVTEVAVANVALEFNNGAAQAITISLVDKAPALEDALTDKFGPPARRRDTGNGISVEWGTNDEELAVVGLHSIVMTRPSLLQALRSRIASLKKEAEDRKKALIKPARQDF